MAGKKNALPVYDFDHPIRILRYRGGGKDIFFYSVLLSLITLATLLILFWRDGKLVYAFTLGRSLLAFPLVMLILILGGMLREIRTYTTKLAAKSEWTIEELMEMTGRDREQTEHIISRVLEVGFTVDRNCILNWEELGGSPG